MNLLGRKTIRVAIWDLVFGSMLMDGPTQHHTVDLPWFLFALYATYILLINGLSLALNPLQGQTPTTVVVKP